MIIIEIISLFIIFVYLVPLLTRSNSPQLCIKPVGFKKVPKLFFKLAKIEKDDYENLDATEEKRFTKCYRKFEKVSSAWLTFLYSQRLIHVQLPAINKSYFFPIGKNEKEVVREKIGNLDEDTYVWFIVHRQKMGRFRSPVLTGYIKKDKEGLSFLKDEEKEIELLFEFPEALVEGGPFAKRLKNKYKLEETVVADYVKDELGYNRDVYCVDYKQEHKNGGIFDFLLTP